MCVNVLETGRRNRCPPPLIWFFRIYCSLFLIPISEISVWCGRYRRRRRRCLLDLNSLSRCVLLALDPLYLLFPFIVHFDACHSTVLNIITIQGSAPYINADERWMTGRIKDRRREWWISSRTNEHAKKISKLRMSNRLLGTTPKQTLLDTDDTQPTLYKCNRLIEENDKCEHQYTCVD